jgi:hypothetical protein
MRGCATTNLIFLPILSVPEGRDEMIHLEEGPFPFLALE